MTKTRASFFDNAPEVDVSAFEPKKRTEAKGPAMEQLRAVAEAANFPSREATPKTPKQPAAPKAPDKRPARVHRTGRNVQFNVKGSRETVEAFYAITEEQGWVLGYTLERAIAALQRELEETKSS
jgi:hypothetical protein